ncbi:MAG: peptide ABC transporter substrate-binding protein [Chloroflexota bacterium]
MNPRSAIPGLLLVFVATLAFLGACEAKTVEVTRIVTETVIVEGETIEVTRMVTEEVEVTRVVEAETGETERDHLVTLDGYSLTDIPELDPQIAGDTISRTYIENLFLQLTSYDAATSEIVPEVAVNWESSEDGLTWTFHLRTDVPWVYHNPITGETTHASRPQFDESGQRVGETPAFVNANDFVASFRRACDPTLNSRYSNVVAPLIAGCSAVLNAQDSAALTDDDFAAIGVSAPDESTLVVRLAFPAGYFLSMTPLWTFSATPAWTIAQHGHDWTEAGNIVTAGPYVLDEWVHGVRRTLLRNRLMPEDMRGEGNIERIRVDVVSDTNSGYQLWLENEVDQSEIPDARLAGHLDQFAGETISVSDLAVFYFSFRHTRPPFDLAEVRRAFSAALDREAFVEEVRLGQGQPMKHFAPPSIFGAPPIDEVGVGFDPQYARDQLAAAGYPDCSGFPPITLRGFSGRESLDWIEFAVAQWQEHLGCPPQLIQVEQHTFEELLAAASAELPDEEAPHIWTMGWAPEYPDENNWVGDALWCEHVTETRRACTETDELIVAAREETNARRRQELYRQIEESFFGPQGEMPIAPLYLRTVYRARHNWLEGDIATFSGQQWYNWIIDWEAKQAAQDP